MDLTVLIELIIEFCKTVNELKFSPWNYTRAKYKQKFTIMSTDIKTIVVVTHF